MCLPVCKFKAHKRCAVRATNNCKWTTLASIGKDIIEDEDGVSTLHIYRIFQSCFFFMGEKKRLSIEILPCNPLELTVGGYIPEHFSKINMVFRTKVTFLSHKASLVSVGTRLQPYYNILKATCRETLKLENCSQKFLLLLSKGGILCCYHAVLAVYFVCPLLIAVPQDACLEFTDMWGLCFFLLMKAGILKLAGEMTKAFQRFIMIDGLFLQTQPTYVPLV